MKRIHVHMTVDDLGRSIGFYSVLFAARPTFVKDDYAKWMLDDPRVKLCDLDAGARTGPRSSRHSGRGTVDELREV